MPKKQTSQELEKQERKRLELERILRRERAKQKALIEKMRKLIEKSR